MKRTDLLPSSHRAERLLLLDLLGGNAPSAVFGREVDADAFLAVTPETVLPLVHARLAPLAEALRVPRTLSEALSAHYRRSALMHLRRSADLRGLEAAFGAAKIPHLVLKGPVLAALVYPHPATRAPHPPTLGSRLHPTPPHTGVTSPPGSEVMKT